MHTVMFVTNDARRKRINKGNKIQCSLFDYPSISEHEEFLRLSMSFLQAVSIEFVLLSFLSYQTKLKREMKKDEIKCKNDL